MSGSPEGANQAADNAGYTDEADKMRNRLNSMDNIDRQDRMNEWQMKHGDEQLKAQEKHYRAIENQAASALNPAEEAGART